VTYQVEERVSYSLRQYIDDVCAVFDESLAVPARLRRIAEHKRRLLEQPHVLSPAQLLTKPGKPYTRNLLFRDPRGRFVVVAILWGSRTVSPVHDHRTWGVMGVYDNYVRITNFERLDDGSVADFARLEPREGVIAPRGSVGYVLPPFQEVHQMENPTGRATIGIHTYGRAVEECTVFDLATGKTTLLPLSFDHDVTAELDHPTA
jgi:3-mercaptopropionate dioxygenase